MTRCGWALAAGTGATDNAAQHGKCPVPLPSLSADDAMRRGAGPGNWGHRQHGPIRKMPVPLPSLSADDAMRLGAGREDWKPQTTRHNTAQHERMPLRRGDGGRCPEFPVGLLEVVDGGDVRVLQRGERFAAQAGEALGIRNKIPGTTVIATCRRSRVSVARYTSPVQSSPSVETISPGPTEADPANRRSHAEARLH